MIFGLTILISVVSHNYKIIDRTFIIFNIMVFFNALVIYFIKIYHIKMRLIRSQEKEVIYSCACACSIFFSRASWSKTLKLFEKNSKMKK